MIRKGDIQWWVLEARKYPESASIAIEFLAERLAELDAENEQLRNELIRLRQGTSTEASSGQIQALRGQIEKLEYLLKSQAAVEPSAVFYSDQLRSARMPLSEVQKRSRSGQAPLDRHVVLSLRCLLSARPHDELLLITSQGRGMMQLVPDLPPLSEDGRWPNAPSPWLREGERLSVAVTIAEPPRFWTIATRKGYVQRFVRAAFEREMEGGDPLLRSLFDRDEASAIVDGDRGDLVVFTRWGYANRFSHRVIDVQGSLSIDLESGDEVVGALSLPEEGEILIVTAAGLGIRRSTEQLPARAKPGGGGKRLIRAHDVIAVYPYARQDSLLFLTMGGRLLLAGTGALTPQDRLGAGEELCDLEHDPAVAVALVPHDLL
jgi:DNA gyrase/topoisomerase IV subunit A